MSFEDELTRSLAESRQMAAQQERAALDRAALGLQALARVEAKCREAAAFLAAHHVPTEPFIDEWITDGFLFAKRKQVTVAKGWKLTEWLALSDEGQLWQIEENHSNHLVTCKPWDLKGLRESIEAGETAKLPLGGYVLTMPSVGWIGDMREEHPLRVGQQFSDLSAQDVEAVPAQKVVELARTQGR